MKKSQQQIIAEVLNFQVTTSILDHVSDLVWVKDLDGRYNAASESFNKLFGLKKDYIIGKTLDDFRPGNLDDVLDDERVISSRETTVSQKSQRLANGEIKFFEVRKSPTYDMYGEINGIVAIGRDITDTIRYQEYLHYLGYHDVLTKLNNRNYFEQIPEKLRKGKVREVGVLICDIDGLKLVNDALGHADGDERLIKAADILKRAVGNYGELARIGGDEFVIVAPNASQKVLDEIIRRMKWILEKENHGGEIFPLNISFGVAIGNLDQTDFFSIVKEADNAMYRDKMLHVESARNSMVKTVLKMLAMKDYIMEGHAGRMQEYVAAIGQAKGLPEGKLNDLRLLAEFHDIGKIGIPENLLKKPGPLTAEEAALMHRHPEIGFHLAQSIPELAPITDWILKHHEWWDGTGYPLGLKGHEIPLEARIVHIADAFDAMTHNRPYRKALSYENAVNELRKGAGTQFDPDLVAIFLSLVQEGAILA